MTTRIAILGDFNPIYSTHHALNDSIRQISKHFREEIQFDWISTEIFKYKTAFNNLYSGLWVAPGSPYKDMQNVIATIAYTRKNNIPTLGNCGGFQHMIIEFARNVCGIVAADHEETNPDSADLVISELSCSLKGQEEELNITDRDSILYDIVKADKFLGRYYCSYGLNSSYIRRFTANGLRITAISSDHQVRSFELKSHPFFLGTLFQPALTSTIDHPNPIIIAFVKRCVENKKNQYQV